jgi:hypothetical protein
MNTANLQLEGLLLSISFLFETMRRKGLLTKQEIDAALQEAETSLKLEAVKSDLSPANLEAIRFPIHFLRAATNMTSTGQVSFATLTAMAVETRHSR